MRVHAIDGVDDSLDAPHRMFESDCRPVLRPPAQETSAGMCPSRATDTRDRRPRGQGRHDHEGRGSCVLLLYRYDRRHPRAASLQYIHSEGGGPDTSMLRNCARRFAYPPRASSRRSLALHVGAKSAVGRAEVVKDRPDRLHQVGRGHRAPVLCKGGRAEAAREQAARVCCERGRGRPIGRQLRLGGARPAKHRGNRTRQDVALTAAPLRATALRVLEHGRAGTRRRHVHVASGGDLGRSSVGGRWGSRRRCLSVGCEARVHSRR